MKIESRLSCLGKTCKNNKCVKDKNGEYSSEELCNIACSDDETSVCSKVNKFVFDFFGLHLSCEKGSQQLQIVVFVVLVWIGVLLF